MKAHTGTRTPSWTVSIGFACTDSDNEESEGSEDCREAHVVNRVKTMKKRPALDGLKQ
jgi:hypothetical protein